MKTFQLNPAVKEFDVTIILKAETLLDKGWEMDMTEKEAKKYAAIVRISGERGDDGFPYTSLELNEWKNQNNRLSQGVKEDTGDDEATINDLIELLNDGILTIEEIENNDMSVDENETYTKAFIEA